jgi:Helicase conserved C-terminal domain
MAEFFDAAGVRAAAVHSGESSAPRAASLERLESGELDIVFAVDMFNEGVDLPSVDTVMMLRPTESRVLWLQQFGRGLRRADAKDHLTVVDYIGNHRTFLIKPQTLLGLPQSDAAVKQALERYANGTLDLPPGCEVTYDLRAVEILRALLRVRPDSALSAWYADFRDRHGTRPLAVEAFHEGYNPRAARRSHGSWLRMVAELGDLDSSGTAVTQDAGPDTAGPTPGGFLEQIEITPMTRSYKMLVLLAMLNEDRLPGAIDVSHLVRAIGRLAERSAQMQADIGVPLTDVEGVRRHLEQNPIAAWCGGAGTGGTEYFRYEGRVFASRFDVPTERREAFQTLARELVEWRLAEYLARTPSDEIQLVDRIVCKVSHANRRPILFLPDRAAHPAIPRGTVPIVVDGEAFEADFVKVAVNVIRKPGSERNELPRLMRTWFGPNAGLPGTSFSVVFERRDDGWHLSPNRQ